jgi:Flp pilus assembly protein TadD
MRRLIAALLLLAAAPLTAQTEPPPPVRVLRTGGLRVETAALLMSGQEGGTIPLATLVLPLPASAGSRSRVLVLLEMDGAETVAGQTTGLLRLEVCLYAITGAGAPAEGGPGGRVAGSRMDTVEVDLSRVGPDLERSGLKYVGELDLPPGEYALRALVRNSATAEVGLRSIAVAVPDFSQRPGLILPPLLPEPADAWLVARGAGLASPPSVFSMDALPSARPILAPSVKTDLRVAAWKLEGSSDWAVAGLRVEVRRPGGARVATFPLEISGREASTIPGLEILTASFEPKEIEEGVYEIRALPAEGRGDDAAILSTSFVLLERGSDGQVWAALTQPRRAQAGQPDTAVASTTGERKSPPARRGRRVRRIDAGPVKAAYRQALALLASGEREAARVAVTKMETSVLSGEKPASSEDLLEVELDVAQEVSRGEAEAVVPLLTLHQVIYRDSVRRQSFLLSTHDRELVFRLAALYADRSGTPEGRKKAARFLDGIAAEMIWTAPPSLRARLYKQILSFDPEDRTALLCMAVDAERQGRYAEAVGHLEHLERLRPGQPEVLLRLSVNLARIGKVQDARRILSNITGISDRTRAEPWHVAVASQELARMLMAAGDLDAAEAAVREGLRRQPDDDKLAIQLGMIRDLRKDPRGAREAVAKVGIKTGGSGGAARNRYNRMPLEELDRAWSELQQAALDLLPSLAAALGVPGPAEAPRNTP